MAIHAIEIVRVARPAFRVAGLSPATRQLLVEQCPDPGGPSRLKIISVRIAVESGTTLRPVGDHKGAVRIG